MIVGEIVVESINANSPGVISRSWLCGLGFVVDSLRRDDLSGVAEVDEPVLIKHSLRNGPLKLSMNAF